jgi:hypothetical protein
MHYLIESQSRFQFDQLGLVLVRKQANQIALSIKKENQ